MFKISNRYTKKWCEICWKLTIKTTEWHLHVIFVFILLWIYFTCFSSVSTIDFKPVNIAWVLSDHGDITVLYLNAQIKHIDIMDHARNINTAKTVIFHRNTDFSRILVFKRTEKYFFFLKKKKFISNTAWKVSVFGIFLVRIFPHLDWIRRDAVYLPVFSPNAGKYGPEELQIRILFTQWNL